MNTVLISILMVAAMGNVIVLLLLRSSSNRAFATEVREDLRIGREELRSSNKIAIDTDAGGIGSFADIGRTLGSRMKSLQEGRCGGCWGR